MSSDPDRYEAFYAAKLWSLLPAIYRAEDSDDFDRKGPLQELVDRIGAQAAIVRRSIDRLWEDQSIETCDDWLIDYIGDLLATNLVAGLDARGRRIDVSKTIRYRRRKGTLALLEELASDITGWSARVVEFSQRLGRTRHGLDPEIGVIAQANTPEGRLQRAQRLIGARTGSGAGGYADLRDVLGARLAHTAFDEYAHTADVRRGRGHTGWHDIPRLGVFVWRLRSFRVRQVTPVADQAFVGLPSQLFTFDPTGRHIPLFAAGGALGGDQWVSPQPEQVPGPIPPELLDDMIDGRSSFPLLYPSSLALHSPSATGYELVPAAALAHDRFERQTKTWIDPSCGRIMCPKRPAEPFRVDYHYGFSSEIGAGPYERPACALPEGVAPPLEIKAIADPQATLSVPPIGSLVIGNSLTYCEIAPLASIEFAELHAKDQERPLLRLPAGRTWTFHGQNASAMLVLDGLFVSGGEDVVLSGTFERVTLSCCTLDPGTRTGSGSAWATAVDGRTLAPTRLRIEGRVRELVVERCITGPIATEGNGRIELLVIRESIVQAADPAAAAIVVPAGEVALGRTTVLGRARVHRLDASECILHDVAEVDDRQHGCVRFSAYAASASGPDRLPRKYQSVAIAVRAPLFGTLAFGRPEYAQLLATAGAAIAEGAEDGSEIGAFWRERSAIKERSLLIKYQEYLPLGLEPVVIHAT